MSYDPAIPAHEWDDDEHRAEVWRIAVDYWVHYEYEWGRQRKNILKGKLRVLEKACANAEVRREILQKRAEAWRDSPRPLLVTM